MRRSLFTMAILASQACAGAGEEEPPVDPVEEACLRIEEGTVIDAGPTPEEATELTLGSEPWRVGLYPDQVSFVTVTTSGAPVVFLADAADVFASLSTDGAEVELPAATENPVCPQDIPSVLELDLPSGTHTLGVGPHYKATLWMVLTEQP